MEAIGKAVKAHIKVKFEGDRNDTAVSRLEKLSTFCQGLKDTLRDPVVVLFLDTPGYTFGNIADYVCTHSLSDPVHASIQNDQRLKPDEWSLTRNSYESLTTHFFVHLIDATEVVTLPSRATAALKEKGTRDIQELVNSLHKVHNMCSVYEGAHGQSGTFTYANMLSVFIQLTDIRIQIKLSTFLKDLRDPYGQPLMDPQLKWEAVVEKSKSLELKFRNKDSLLRSVRKSQDRRANQRQWSSPEGSHNRTPSPKRGRRGNPRSPSRDVVDRQNEKAKLTQLTLKPSEVSDKFPEAPNRRFTQFKPREATSEDLCHNCGKSGHFRRDCPDLTEEERKKFMRRPFVPRPGQNRQVDRTRRQLTQISQEQDYSKSDLRYYVMSILDDVPCRDQDDDQHPSPGEGYESEGAYSQAQSETSGISREPSDSSGLNTDASGYESSDAEEPSFRGRET